MTPEHLETILKFAQAKEEKGDKEGWRSLPEGTTLTFHVAHDGAAMSMPRVESIRREGELVWAKTGKKETAALLVSDIFAVLIDGQPGAPVRRPGFGT